MTDPKPISVTYVAPSDYTGPDPQPFAIVGEPAEVTPATFAEMDGSVAGVSGANLQAILEDIATRLAAVEV